MKLGRQEVASREYLRLNLQTKDGTYESELRADNIGNNNQRFILDATKAGEHYLTVIWDQIPHLYNTSAQSIWGGVGTPNLTTSVHIPGSTATATPAGIALMNAAVAGKFNTIDVGIDRKKGTVAYRWTPDPNWDVRAAYSNEKREGTQIAGVAIGLFASLVIIWFGFGLLPKVLVIVLATFFPIVVALLDGLASTDRDALELLRSMGASEREAFRKVRLPAALPAFFTGLRISITYAVVGAVFAEYVGAYEGLGIWMQLARNAYRTDLVFGAIAITALLSVGLFVLAAALERLVIPWHRGRATAG